MEELKPCPFCGATDCISRADVEQTVEDNILCYTHSDRPIDQDADTECHMAIRMALKMLRKDLRKLPSAQPEDYAELKREFLRMASYIDVLLECSDEQKETLIGFISRLAEFMPWTERD